MRRFLLDTGIAGLYLERRRGVFERATAEVAAGNRVGGRRPGRGRTGVPRRGQPEARTELASSP